MRKKHLQAENLQLKAQLAAHKHETRKALNLRVKASETALQETAAKLVSALALAETLEKQKVELQEELNALLTAAKATS